MTKLSLFKIDGKKEIGGKYYYKSWSLKQMIHSCWSLHFCHSTSGLALPDDVMRDDPEKPSLLEQPVMICLYG